MLLFAILCGCQQKTIEYNDAVGPVVNMQEYGIDSTRFHFINYDGLLELFDTDVTTIVYIGHIGCPWCETLVPYLNDVCNEYDYDIYYLDSLYEDNLGRDDAVDALANICIDFVTKDTDGTPTIWAPSIIYIQEGKPIAVHEGTVNTHNAYEREMTEKETARLQYMLNKEFSAITGGN